MPCHDKQGKERGGCEAPEKNWSFTFDWLNVPPKICNQRLTLRVFDTGPPYRLSQFDMETGKELARKSVKKSVTDVCSVKFD